VILPGEYAEDKIINPRVIISMKAERYYISMFPVLLQNDFDFSFQLECSQFGERVKLKPCKR